MPGSEAGHLSVKAATGVVIGFELRTRILNRSQQFFLKPSEGV